MSFPLSPDSVAMLKNDKHSSAQSISTTCSSDASTDSSFDILSKWYINGELEIRKSLHDSEKLKLVKEINRLHQEKRDINREKCRNEKKLNMYIDSLKSKVDILERDKIKLKETIVHLEKKLLGENDWYAEKQALDNALDDFIRGLKT